MVILKVTDKWKLFTDLNYSERASVCTALLIMLIHSFKLLLNVLKTCLLPQLNSS